MWAIKSLNFTCNSVSGRTTPHQLLTRTKPSMPAFSFGQVGVFYMKRQDSPDDRSEWGIFIDHAGSQQNHFRAYIPTRNAIYSKRRFELMSTVPPEWQYPPRIRPLLPQQPRLRSAPPVQGPNTDVQTGTPVYRPPVGQEGALPDPSSHQEGVFMSSAPGQVTMSSASGTAGPTQLATKQPNEPSWTRSTT